jgi:hypothetical protein
MTPEASCHRHSHRSIIIMAFLFFGLCATAAGCSRRTKEQNNPNAASAAAAAAHQRAQIQM